MKTRKTISKKSNMLFSTVFLLLFCSFSSHAQSELIIHRGNIIQDGRTLKSADEIRNVMSVNSEALRAYNSGHTLAITGVVFGCIGGGLIGVGLVQLITPGSESAGTLLATGLVATGVGFGFALIGRGKAKEAVSLYNSGIKNTAYSYQIDFGLTQTGGIGFTMRF